LKTAGRHQGISLASSKKGVSQGIERCKIQITGKHWIFPGRAKIGKIVLIQNIRFQIGQTIDWREPWKEQEGKQVPYNVNISVPLPTFYWIKSWKTQDRGNVPSHVSLTIVQAARNLPGCPSFALQQQENVFGK